MIHLPEKIYFSLKFFFTVGVLNRFDSSRNLVSVLGPTTPVHLAEAASAQETIHRYNNLQKFT